jgi:hypothetical protein
MYCFIVIGALLFIQLISFVLYTTMKFMCIRFLMHLFWIIVTLLTIVTFIAGSVFGITGQIAKDLVPLFNFIFSNNNLMIDRYIITNPDTAENLNICINYGGDIAGQVFNLQNSQVDYLNRLYQSVITMKNYQQIIMNNIQTSQSIPSGKTYLASLAKDISILSITASGYFDSNPDLPYGLLQEMNKWTDSSLSTTFQLSCKTNTYDQWVFSQSNCPNGYTYMTSSPQSTTFKTCLVLSEWSEATFTQRYSQNPSECKGQTSVDFKSVSEAAIAYYNALTQMKTENQNLINQMNNDLEKYYLIFYFEK